MKLTSKDSWTIPEYVLSAVEQSWGFKLPRQYRKFLLKNNGSILEGSYSYSFKNGDKGGSVLERFFWVCPSENYNLLYEKENFKNRVPSNMLAIADDPFGNLILIAVKMADYGKIYFWDHDREAEDGEEPTYENLTLIADSFDEFINNLKDMKEMGG